MSSLVAIAALESLGLGASRPTSGGLAALVEACGIGSDGGLEPFAGVSEAGLLSFRFGTSIRLDISWRVLEIIWGLRIGLALAAGACDTCGSLGVSWREAAGPGSAGRVTALGAALLPFVSLLCMAELSAFGLPWPTEEMMTTGGTLLDRSTIGAGARGVEQEASQPLMAMTAITVHLPRMSVALRCPETCTLSSLQTECVIGLDWPEWLVTRRALL
ncbi:MAG: hypothetical protein ACK4WE_09435 [Burkholderiales bacterium]